MTDARMQPLEMLARSVSIALKLLSRSRNAFARTRALKSTEIRSRYCTINFWQVNDKDVGTKCGTFEAKIPGIFVFSVSSELRARGGPTPIKVGSSADEQLVGSVSFKF